MLGPSISVDKPQADHRLSRSAARVAKLPRAFKIRVFATGYLHIDNPSA